MSLLYAALGIGALVVYQNQNGKSSVDTVTKENRNRRDVVDNGRVKFAGDRKQNGKMVPSFIPKNTLRKPTINKVGGGIHPGFSTVNYRLKPTPKRGKEAEQVKQRWRRLERRQRVGILPPPFGKAFTPNKASIRNEATYLAEKNRQALNRNANYKKAAEAARYYTEKRDTAVLPMIGVRWTQKTVSSRGQPIMNVHRETGNEHAYSAGSAALFFA